MADVKKTYPHVNQIPDFNTQQAVKLLWDHIHALTDRVSSAEDNITTATTNISSLEASAKKANYTANQAMITAGNAIKIRVTAGTGVSSGPSGGSGGGLNDNGEGAAGCAAAGSTGHVDPSLPRDNKTAGMIVCGVGKEFPNLLVVTVDQPTRDANRAELLNRMIWHLNLQGFPTSHYGNPPNAFLLLIQIGGNQFAYRVTGYETFETAMTTTMVFGGETLNAPVVPDGGTPD